MNVLLGYGYYPGTTGIYIEKWLSKYHHVTFVGTPWYSRPGYMPNLDLGQLVPTLPHAPDLFLYVDSGHAPYAPIGLENLDCPTAAYLIDAWPPGISQRNTFRLRLAPLFDYVFVAHRGAVELYRSWRNELPVHWLPLACDPDIHADQHCKRIYDVGFVGQYNPASYPQRTRMLEALQARYRMNDFRQPYYLEEMARVYSQSKIVINISHTNRILNMRFFEVPATGALLMTEHSEDNGQAELLREGQHFVTFRGMDDLLSKVEYYLKHSDEREHIARAGQAEVLTHHTYGQRINTLLDTITTDGLKRRAPARSWTPQQCALAYMRVHSMMRLVDPIMDVRWGETKRRGKTVQRIRQAYYVATALLRRVKHEWSGR